MEGLIFGFLVFIAVIVLLAVCHHRDDSDSDSDSDSDDSSDSHAGRDALIALAAGLYAAKKMNDASKRRSEPEPPKKGSSGGSGFWRE